MVLLFVILFVISTDRIQTVTSGDTVGLPEDTVRECRQSGMCYMFMNKSLPWSEAVKTCQSYNGTVLSIKDPAENEWVASRLRMLHFPATFLGIKYDEELQSYILENGSLPDYINNQLEYEIVLHKINGRNGQNTKKVIRTKRGVEKIDAKKKVIYSFKYTQFMNSYLKDMKSKLDQYRENRNERSKKILLIKENLLKKWKIRIQWLKSQNWETWFKTIRDIKSEVWIRKMKDLIKVIEKGDATLVKLMWNSWWHKIILWYQDWIKKYNKAQIDIIWRWKEFVTWLRKHNWQTVIGKIDGIDQKLWEGRIKRIIWVVENRKYTDICDKDWSNWRVTIKSWLEMVDEKRKDILDNDAKRIVVLEWKKRVDWLKRHHANLLIKYSNATLSWKNEALITLQKMINFTNNYEIKSLLEPGLLVSWNQIKEQVETSIATPTEKTSDVQINLQWINRLHWLENKNILYSLEKNGDEKDKTQYKNFVTIVTERKFNNTNQKEINQNFINLKAIIEKQQNVVLGKLDEVTVLRMRRSAVKYFDIPMKDATKLDLPDSIESLKNISTIYPMLENFLINELLKLHYLSSKLNESKIEPNEILFQTLIKDHMENLHKLKLPLNFWKLLSSVKFPGLSVNLKRGDCLTMGYNTTDYQLWQRANCNKPQQFICQIKS